MRTVSILLSQFRNTFWRLLAFSGPFSPLLAMYLIALLLLSANRIVLIFWQLDRVQATHQLVNIFVQGVRVDLILLGLIAIVPLALSSLFMLFKAWKHWRQFMRGWLVVAIVLIVFLEMASFGFIAEYDVRPNRLFIEYLKYPQEVVPMLWNGFRVYTFLGLISLVISAFAMINLTAPLLKQENTLSVKRYWIGLPLIFLIMALSIRSSLGHRPANPAMFAMTNDNMVNSLILNSPYSVLYAIYNLKHESHTSKMYGKMSIEEMLKTFESTREMLGDVRPLVQNKQFPTLVHQVPSQKRQKPLNIVIILEESLGATFVESLGGKPVTPELEKLKQQGWWFENLYATGTRSVRGIEAVVAGFPPTPADSVVKLSLSQDHFTTIASLLADKGYDTQFIYGGESHFDNMRSFFMGNGFQHIVDQKNFEHPTFVGSWGVSDEDLLDRAHQEIKQQYATGKPFFKLIFSSSNHAPFDYPDGRIKPYENPKATENNAVKYADYALGQFFKKAKASQYFKDTLFLIVADHDIRVRGDSLIPIKNFHIPGLILGADVQPKTIQSVTSQIDLPITLLSLAGLDITTPMFGRDISAENALTPGRAMMQYYDNYAWMEGDSIVILRPEQPPTYAHIDQKSRALLVTKAPTNSFAITNRALAAALLPTWLYQEKRFQTDLSLQNLQFTN